MTSLIASRDNASFKALRLLASDAVEQRRQGRTVIDGPHLLGAALDAGADIVDLLLAESCAESPEFAVLAARARRTPRVLRDALFREVAGVATPTGIAAVVAVPPQPTFDAAQDALVLCGVQDAGNVGALLRTCAAAGVPQAVLDRQCAGAWTPKVLRAGQGAHFRLKVVEQADIAVLLGSYRGTVVATVARDGVPPWCLDAGRPLAWLFGNEGAGLGPDMLALAGQRVCIPMAAGCESLNVAAAAAVCLFDTVRRG